MKKLLFFFVITFFSTFSVLDCIMTADDRTVTVFQIVDDEELLEKYDYWMLGAKDLLVYLHDTNGDTSLAVLSVSNREINDQIEENKLELPISATSNMKEYDPGLVAAFIK